MQVKQGLSSARLADLAAGITHWLGCGPCVCKHAHTFAQAHCLIPVHTLDHVSRIAWHWQCPQSTVATGCLTADVGTPLVNAFHGRICMALSLP